MGWGEGLVEPRVLCTLLTGHLPAFVWVDFVFVFFRGLLYK